MARWNNIESTQKLWQSGKIHSHVKTLGGYIVCLPLYTSMLPVNVYVIHRLCCLTVRFFMCQHVLLSCWGTAPRGRPELISLISCKMCFVYMTMSGVMLLCTSCLVLWLLLNYCFQCLNLPRDYTILCVCVCPLWAWLHYGLFLGILSGTQSKTKHLNNSWMDSHSCSTDLFCILPRFPP